MLRYVFGITLLALGIIVIRALSNGKILRKHQYAFWIIVIMNEEMPAYYEGQKSFDEVCFIIGNRVNLMLSERG